MDGEKRGIEGLDVLGSIKWSRMGRGRFPDS